MPLKAFHVDEMTIFAADNKEHAALLYETDVGDKCEEPDYPQELTDAELDKPIKEFDDNEQPTGRMTTIRTFLIDATPGFLAGTE